MKKTNAQNRIATVAHICTTHLQPPQSHHQLEKVLGIKIKDWGTILREVLRSKLEDIA